MDKAGGERSGTAQALAGIPEEPSRSHCRHGFLHRADDHLRYALLSVRRPDRRRILHINVTRHPTSAWILQQLREAFPYGSAPHYLLFDRDAKYGMEIPIAVRSMGMAPVRISFACPWQNGVAERWIGSARRDLLDQVIALNEKHLMRLLSSYVRYYHEDRTHLGLDKETPGQRVCSAHRGRILAFPRLAGLHHRYDRAA